MHISAFVPLHAYVCVSPVCEPIWSSLNWYVHYRAMTRETLVLILFRMKTEKRQDGVRGLEMRRGVTKE